MTTGLTYERRPSSSTTMVTSEEFWINERNRSSLSRIEFSAFSFCSITTPAIRMTKRRTTAPIKARALARGVERNDGAQCCQMATCPATIPARLHEAVVRQTCAPPAAMFSRTKNAKASTRAGPQPVR